MTLLDRKYASLLIGTGVNLQKGQTLVINADPVHHEFVEILVETAYKKGARRVVVKYGSEALSRLHYLHQDINDLITIPTWLVEEYDSYMEEDLCKLALRSPSPGVMGDVDSGVISKVTQATGEALFAYQNYSMSDQGQWLVCAYPTETWAKAVFPKEDVKIAYTKLYEAILSACRVSEDNDPEAEWQEHNRILHAQNKALNHHDFSSIHFTNEKGTDLTVGLVENHQWHGGSGPTQKGVMFNANMPTEESFTTPDRMRVDGIVYNSLPLNNNGRIIDEFWLKFENGRVVDFDAKVGKEALASLLDIDEHSRRIGEIALVSKTSPIYRMGSLFYNTLFDENASCHIALGKGYPLIPNGGSMSKEALLEAGVNQSLIHVDFMFGTEDMSATGISKDGTKIPVMKDGMIIIA